MWFLTSRAFYGMQKRKCLELRPPLVHAGPMAVYTQITESALKEFLLSYDIGNLVRFEGIEQGVSNTNYHLFTDKGRYILTLFEPHRVHESDIPYYVDYAVVLEREGVAVPRTMLRKDRAVLGRLSDRPAVIYSFLEGDGGHAAMLNPDICEKAGRILGQMHLAGSKITKTAVNHYGLNKFRLWVDSMNEQMDQIEKGMFNLTQNELSFIENSLPNNLPSGAIHADFFPDNVFFKNEDVTGVIDFHFVCHDIFAYDLAIAINAWCFDIDNNFAPTHMDAMLKGYNDIRPLSDSEREALPILLRAGALRFLLSRIEEKLAWTPDRVGKPHDPLVFKKRLNHFQNMSAQ
jgi:homoserine kinase type II